MKYFLKLNYSCSIQLFFLIILFSCSKFNKNNTVFTLINSNKVGIDYVNNLSYSEDFNTYTFRSFYNGAGVGLADFNNDGNLDVFFSGNQSENAFYLGDGQFNFTDVSDIAGITSPNSWSTGVSVLDINNDGLLDLYVCKSGKPNDFDRRNELFINIGIDENGIPRFSEQAKDFGIDILGYSVHAQFFDYDLDGDLDMYISNNSINPSTNIMDVKKGLRDNKDDLGGDLLYRNDNGFFIDVTKTSGIYTSSIGFGLGVSISDINLDGWPDIYVANDFFEKDYLYINNQDGTFKESSEDLIGELSLGSMGVDIVDMNNDGYPEIFVTEMLPKTESRLKTKSQFEDWDKYILKKKNGYHRQFPRNMFQLNNSLGPNGKVSFSDISRYSGVGASDWSWGVQMVDFDLDGMNEIFVTNGIAKDLLDQDYIDFYNNPVLIRQIFRSKGRVIKELIDNIPSEPISNFMYRQNSHLKFSDISKQWGMDQKGFSNGSAYGDIDNDGDLDLIVNNINDKPFIYRNNINSGKRKNNFLSIEAQNKYGSPSIGTKVMLRVGDKKYFKELFVMRGSMSFVDPRLNFGLGKDSIVDTLKIVWPNGKRTIKTNVKANQFLSISEKNSIQVKETKNLEIAKQVFEDVTSKLNINYRHKENNFVDFDRERLLYHMKSNEGPKIAVADVNGDGMEDFFVGGAKNSSGSLFIQNKSGFYLSNKKVFGEDKESEDTGVLFFDADMDNDMDLFVCSGGMAFSKNSFALFDRLYINDGNGNFTKSKQFLPSKVPRCTSTVVALDYDKDGDKDLFLGGRMVISNYGIPASSFILENNGNGEFRDVTDKVAPDFKKLGMVTDALNTDYDRDGDQDLVIVGEWMPISVFSNEEGKFYNITSNLGLDNSNGFWNTIEKADLNGDGYLDLLVGNLGENTFFKASNQKPLKMYVNDFDKNGKTEQIISLFNGDMAFPVSQKKEITSQLPFLLKKYLKHNDYKEKTVNEIFDYKELKDAIELDIKNCSTSILWNYNGGKFNLEKLSSEAQLSPVYAVLLSDFNNDDKVDIIIGGNQFRAKPQTGIYAGSQGVVYENYYNKIFKILKSKKSGIFIKDEIRDIKEIQVGNKKHILVSTNNNKLRCYSTINEN
ncbi:MAG: VCBS repeat-containing protein [Bacteroidota bacterium]|nr:VCBS repeat-containing protein [Bacteroidota bacterium]